MLPPRARVFIALTAVLAAGAVALLLAVHDGELVYRPWLVAAVAALIGLEHLFSTRLVRQGAQGETTTHEEAYIVALALLEPGPAVVAAVAAGFVIGSFVVRRELVKSFFNVSSMTLATATAMLTVEALGGGTSDSRWAIAAVTVGALVFAVVNRLSIAGVLTLVGAGSLRENVLDDAPARALLLAANVAIGLLAGLAARNDVWVLPLGLVAIVVLHYALAGHGRAKAEHQKLEDIVNASSNGILTLDRHGNVASWSDACTEITGFPADEVIGLPFPALGKLLEAELLEFPEPDRGRRYRIKILRQDGEPRWLVVTRNRLPEGGDVLVVDDDTIRRHYDEVREAHLEDQLWSDLIASVSHELRTPLTSILGFTETMLTRPVPDGGAHALPRHHRRAGPPPRGARRRPPQPAHARRGGARAPARGARPPRRGGRAGDRLREPARTSRAPGGAPERAAAPPRGSSPHRPGPRPTCSRTRSSTRRTEAPSRSGPPGATATSSSRWRTRGSASRKQAGTTSSCRSSASAREREADGTGLGLAISRRIVRRHGGELDFESTARQGLDLLLRAPARAAGLTEVAIAAPEL